MAVVGYATIQLIPSLQGFAGSTRGQMAPVVRSVGTDAGKQAGGLFGNGFVGSVGRIMSAAGIYEIGSRVASGFSDAISTGIKGFANLQGYTISFKTLLGSASAANDMIRDLYTFAAKTPFDVQGAVEGARRLVGVGVAGRDVIPMLTTLGDAVGAVGGSTAEFNSTLLAFSQIVNRPRVSTQDLYQVMNAGIPIFQLLSKALGQPIDKIQDMIEKQQLLSKDVLPKLYDVMNQEYGGSMAEQAKTLTGLWSTFKDTMSQVLTKALTPVGEWLVKILPGATTQATAAIQWLQDKFGMLVKYFQDPSNKFGETFQPLIDGLKNTDWETLLGAVGTAFSSMWTIVQPIVKQISDLIGDNLPMAASTLADVLNTLFQPIKDDAPAVSGNLDDVSQKMGEAGQSADGTKQSMWGVFNSMGLVGGGSVNTVLGMVKVADAFLQGKSSAEIMSGVLDGKFGPSLQRQGRLAQTTGAVVGQAFREMGAKIGAFAIQAVDYMLRFSIGLSTNVRNAMAQGAAAIGVGATRMVVSFVTGIATLGARAAAAIGAGIRAAMAGIGAFVSSFRASGASLIDGFIGGILSGIQKARAAAASVVSSVANFFPHSPAPEGPFSGRGWTLYSGRSLVDGFKTGIQQRQGGLRSLMADTFSAPALASIKGPASSVASEVAAATTSRAGAYIGSATVNTTNGNAGVIDELNFLLRNLNRGGR